MQMYMSKPRLGVVTAAWANRPSASTVGALFFATDVGDNGTLMVANGSRWRPMNGVAALDTLGDALSGIANTETLALQTLLPAGAWQTNDILRFTFDPTKSGTTDTLLLNVRIGTAGTTADTALTGLSDFQLLLATGQSGGGFIDVKLVSATSAQRVGQSGTGGQATYTTMNAGNAATVATTITDVSANAVYVSAWIESGGATNTVGLQFGQIQLITP